MWNWKANNWGHPNKTQAFYNQTPTLHQNEVEFLKSFTCPKCKRFYDVQPRGNILTGRVPLILPCEHTICEECLRIAFSQKEIICGECHTGSSLENFDFKTRRFQQVYPVNFYLLGLLYYYKPHTSETSNINFKPAGISFQKSQKQFDSKYMMFYDHSSFKANKKPPEPIRECTKDMCNRPAQVSCAECYEVYCEACCDSLHKTARGLQTHKISPLDCFSSPELKDTCAAHKDSLLEFLCKTCDKNLCCYCVLGAHKNHEFYQVTEIDEGEIPHFKAQIQTAEEMLKKLQTTEKKVIHHLNTNSSASAASNNSIDNTISRCFENLHAKLQILEKQLRKEATDYKNVNYNVLSNIRYEVSSNVFTLTSLVQAAKQIVDGKQKSKLNVKLIQEKMANALKLPCYLLRKKQESDDKSIELICGNLLSDLKDNFSIKSDLGCSFFLVTENELPSDYDIDESSDNGSSTSESLSSHTSSSFPLRASLDRLSTSSLELTPVKPNRTDSVETWIKNVYEDKKVEMQMPKFRKGDRASIIVTHINSPESFYIHLTSMQSALKQLTKNIDNFVKHVSLPVAKPELNHLYLVKYADDRQWSRGRIIKINEKESTFTVLFIDYGNTKKVKKQYITGISTELCEPAPFAKMCKLFDLYPSKDTTWDPNAIKLMAHILTGNDLLMVIMNEVNYSLEVDIITIEGNTSVRDALMFIGYAIPHIRSPTELDNIKKDLKEITDLKLYEKTIDYTKEKTMEVIITFVTDPDNIYVNLHKNQKSLTQLHDSMLKFYKENKKGFIYAPKKDMVVAVSYVTGDVTRWHRGIITDLTEGRGIVTVYLVDIGNTISIPWNYIRRLNERFISVECQAILIKLADVKPSGDVSFWSQNSIHRFDQFIKDQLVLKMVVSKVAQPVEVALFECFPNMHYCINAVLVKEKLAESTGDISLTVEWPQYETPAAAEERTENSESFTINMMKTIQSSKQDALDTSEEDGHMFRKPVEILSIIDPGLIYVKFTEKKQEQHEFNLEFQDYYSKHFFQSPKDLKVNDPCVVYHKKQYYRGIIHGDLPDNKFEVYLRDLGTNVAIEKKSVGVLDAKFQDMRNFAIRCHLAGVIPAGDSKKWSAMACEYLQEFLSNNKDFYLAKHGSIDIEHKSMPVIIWYREIIPGGPLESSKIIYHSINKLLLNNGLALKSKVMDESDESVKSENKSGSSDKCSTGESSKNVEKSVDWNAIMEEELHDKEKVQEFTSLEIQNWLPPLPFESNVFQAKPTFVNDLGEIFLHEVEMDPILQNLEQQMNKAFEKSPLGPQNVIWSRGDLCSVKYFMNDNWYRGKVISADKNSVRVVMVDYGNEEDCTPKDLTQAILYPDVPSLAKKVVLHNVFPKNGKWQTSDLDILHAQIVDKIVTVTLKNSNRSDVKPAVIHLDNLSINQFMLQNSSNLVIHPPKGKKNKSKELEQSMINEVEELQHSDVEVLNESITQEDSDVIVEDEENLTTSAHNSDESIDLDAILTYEHTDIPDQSKVLVAIINVIDFNKVILEIVHSNSNRELFDVISEKIKKEGNTQPIINNPQVDMACIAKFSDDGEWYRAQIFLVNPNDMLTIWFVDFGNFETVKSDSVRAIKPEWVQIPVEQHLAIIHGIELADVSYINDVFEDMSTYFNTVMSAEIVFQNPLSVRLFVKGTDELSYQNLIDKGLLILKED